MRIRHLKVCFIAVSLCAATSAASDMVPFRGVWTGSTVSAEFDPGTGTVFVVSEGHGRATGLGRFFMSSPHVNFPDFSVAGDQIFTAANGDMILATITGQFVGNPAEQLEATLTGTITGGTGRFAGASGSYDFHIVAIPSASGFGFDSVAIIDGSISSVGSLRR